MEFPTPPRGFHQWPRPTCRRGRSTCTWLGEVEMSFIRRDFLLLAGAVLSGSAIARIANAQGPTAGPRLTQNPAAGSGRSGPACAGERRQHGRIRSRCGRAVAHASRGAGNPLYVGGKLDRRSRGEGADYGQGRRVLDHTRRYPSSGAQRQRRRRCESPRRAQPQRQGKASRRSGEENDLNASFGVVEPRYGIASRRRRSLVASATSQSRARVIFGSMAVALGQTIQ